MDIDQMIADLKTQRGYIDEVIDSLERLRDNAGKRRGRPSNRVRELRAADRNDSRPPWESESEPV
jgi:hypothetical protein